MAVLPYQDIKDYTIGASPAILTLDGFPFVEKQFQPASIDLRLGSKVFRNWAANVPYGRFVADIIEKQRKYDFELFADRTHALEAGDTYLIPLLESCALPDDVYFEFSSKSSTGRCDVFARVICDRFGHYDRTPPGYHGPLYLEVTPMSFDIRVKLGLSLVQGRLKKVGTQPLSDDRIKDLHRREGLLCDREGRPLDKRQLEAHDGELFFHIDLDRDIVGFAARNTVTQPLDMTVKKLLEPDDFWTPLRRPKTGELTLVPNQFYLLATKERVRIPKCVCGQIPAYSTTIGEMRTHYAGFFDPNFGGEGGTSGVLEVRVRDMPFTLVDGQVICSMRFEEMESIPSVLYGEEKGSSYMGAGPSLSKHFVEAKSAWEKKFWIDFWQK